MHGGGDLYLQQIYQGLTRSIDELVPVDEENSTYPFRPIVEMTSTSRHAKRQDSSKQGASVDRRRIERNQRERCLLETSSNSIRISFAFKQQTSDTLDQAILGKYVSFFQQRAVNYDILRRRSVGEYAISFLVTSEHKAKYGVDRLVATIYNFVKQVDKECSHVKISINAQARAVAAGF